MRILVVSQYFWPEEFKINDLCLGLKERGHEVTVLTGMPNYPQGKLYDGYSAFRNRKEIWNGIPIYRSLMLTRGNNKGVRLFLNYISFALCASIKALFMTGKYDVIFVWETSPVTVGIPAYFAKLKFKAPIYFWIQDLWPHSISAAGSVNNKTVLRVMDWLTRSIYTGCDHLLIQSEGFRSYLHNQHVRDSKIIYYPNTTEELYTKAASKPIESIHQLPKGFNVLFAGNIGVAQDFPTILKAAAIARKANPFINWVILGDGRAKSEMLEKAKELAVDDIVLFKGFFPPREMPCFFQSADLLLVTLKNEPIFSLTVPSKVQSYLASGKPIIGALNGEGARIIHESGAGIAVAAEDPVALAATVVRMSKMSPSQLAFMGAKGRDYFLQHFERSILLDKIEGILSGDVNAINKPSITSAPVISSAKVTS